MSTAETKTVTLAGQTFDVPPVTFRNAAKIVPLVEKTCLAMKVKGLEEDVLLQIADVVFLGIEKPEGFTKDDLIDLPTSYQEMSAAMFVVAQQAGMKVVTPGEAMAGKAPQNP